ncbi:MAG TPA: xanthine dehydrogenase family protein molybdopterin-binding subunit [Stellaceae bacterium]|jgi:carbon-monoxide dehydrogenase large subunit|nr:xanthine dehydrogenase family protein molybdopterin-binding subunit [Stellaceae bacterium]
MDGSFEPRVEDYRLLTGAGSFQDDEAAAGAAWGVFVRSPHAFADIRGIDTTAAKVAPGVLAVLTAADLDAAGIGTVSVPVPVPGTTGLAVPHRPSLAGDCARHVGDCVALVVAETEAEARDAAELVEVDYAARDAVTDLARAAEPGAPLLWPEAPGNIAVDWHPYGAKPEERAELDRIFATAAHVARVRLVNQRIVMAPMEPRAGLAVYEPETDRYVLHVASQSAFAMRQHVAKTMGVPVEKLRVVSRDVGGAFGMRTSGYPEYPAMLITAKRLGRPVRWRSTRQEGFLSDNQARDTIIEGRLALDANGMFLALDIESLAALGAYQTSHGAFIATVNFARCLPCMYDIPKIGLRIRCLFTNTVPTGPYRGAGRPEANYCLERLVEEAARVTGIDRIEIRRRNLIGAAQIPYKTAVGTTYDSGDFPAVFDAALARADIAGFAARRAASERAGRQRGLGVSCFLEIAGGQPGEGAAVGFPGQSKLLLAIGVQSSGQGHRTLYRRLVADYLGIAAESIEVAHGDSDDEVPSAGAVASRSTMSVGGAVAAALDMVIEKGRRIASHVLEAAEEDIQYRAGFFEIAGTDRNIALFELADRARAMGESLDAKSNYDAIPSFPNGVHIAEVEIDPGTGRTTLIAYTCVDDCGRVLAPVLVEGQVQGGVAQGVGQALLEWGNYDDASGQLVAGSFMDYAMPRADDLPDIVSLMHPVRCTTNPLGVKGVGEAGTTASLAAVMNAVADAGADIDMPASPERVWRALQRKE